MGIKTQKFLSGPIPLDWLCKAAELRGSAFRLGIVIWHQAFLNKNDVVKISSRAALIFCLKRHAVYRGLKLLEEAGLISVQRASGRSPVVKLLKVDDEFLRFSRRAKYEKRHKKFFEK